MGSRKYSCVAVTTSDVEILFEEAPKKAYVLDDISKAAERIPRLDGDLV